MAVITGTARPGETLISDTEGQWYVNDVPLLGHVGYTIVVPPTVWTGDQLRCGESNLLVVPSIDSDAAAWIGRTEMADGGRLLDAPVRWARHYLIAALKDPGYPAPKAATHWDAVLAGQLVITAGAHSIDGSIAKLHPTMPDCTAVSPSGFNYDRIDGLRGDGVTAHLLLGLISSDVPKEDRAVFSWVTRAPTSSPAALVGDGMYTSGASHISSSGGLMTFRVSAQGSVLAAVPTATGMIGVSRHLAGTAIARVSGSSVTGSRPAQDPTSDAPIGYGRGSGAAPQELSDHQSIAMGYTRSVDLAYVDTVLARHYLALQDALGSRPPAKISLRSPMKNVQQGSTGNRATVRLIDSYGEPLTGIPAGDVAITAGPEGGTAVPVAVSGSWTERSGGRYDFAMPDAMYTGTERIYVEGTLAGGTVLGDCHQIVGYDRLEPWATPGDIAAIGAVIPGDDAQTLTITCTADSQPVAGVVIRIAGRRLVTDTAGVATVDLDPGSYTAKYTPPAGFDAVPDGAIVIAAAPVGVAVSLEQQELDPGDSTACPTRFITLNQFDAPARGITIQVEFLRFLESPPKPGIIVNTPEQLTITNADAFVDAYLHRNALYQATFSRGTWRISRSVQFTTPTEGNLIVTEPDH